MLLKAYFINYFIIKNKILINTNFKILYEKGECLIKLYDDQLNLGFLDKIYKYNLDSL